MAKEVRTPDGERWEVGVERPRILPKWRGSIRGGVGSLETGGSAMELAEIPAIGIVFAIVGLLIVALSVVGFILLPAVLFVIELVASLVFAGFALMYGMFRGDYQVVARSRREQIRWRAGSLRDAKKLTDSVAAQLKAGQTPSGATPDAR